MDNTRVRPSVLKITSVSFNEDRKLHIESSWFRLRNDETEDNSHWIWRLSRGSLLIVNDLTFKVYDVSISAHSISINAYTENFYGNLGDARGLLGKYIDYRL